MKIALKMSSAFGLLLAATAASAQPAPAGDANPQPKPGDTKPEKAKPAPAKPGEVKAGAAQPAPGAPGEKKPGDQRPTAPAATPPGTPPPAAGDTAGEPAAPQDETEGAPEAEPLPPAPPPGPATGNAGVGGVSLFPEPAGDATQLKQQGEQRPGARAEEKAGVFAEDWWSHARPVLELHGYFRVRAELFHHFSLGRVESPTEALWPRPADDSYVDYLTGTRYGSNAAEQGGGYCTPEEIDRGDDDDPQHAIYPCKNGTQAGANMRFRLNPELHISDNLRVISQIDMLDNVVFGSTPNTFANQPAAGGGYAVVREPRSQVSFFSDTQDPPASGRNSLQDSISVKRAWAEFALPVGEIRFGRMPNHWGLGMYLNSGDGYDDDYQSTIDRLQVITGLKPLELYFSAAMDFPSEGATSDSVSLPNPQPYDLAQLDDVDQYTFSIARKKNPELERLALTRGDLVFNGGAMLIYRTQQLDDRIGTTGSCAADGAATFGCQPGDLAFVRRGAHAWIPDLWLELKYKRFRFGAEAITVQGSVENLSDGSTASNNIAGGEPYDIRQWGIATELEQKLAEDKLQLAFYAGWASGDPDEDSLAPGGPQLGDTTFSTFRFHPSYHVDLILNRNILQRVQGTYYFRPSVDYDFSRDPNGQRIGGGLTVIWTRASEFMQTPGHARDLGIELNARLYFQSKDGALNDMPDEMGGFYSKLEYGVLFPMSGMGYPDQEAAELNRASSGAADTNVAQAVRLYLGVFF